MYTEPKLFLIDVDQSVKDTLLKYWAEVGTGTLGASYKVATSSNYLQVVQHEQLKGHDEADIIIVDLSEPGHLNKSAGGPEHFPVQEQDLWAKCDLGWIDARARTVLTEQDKFSRIVKNGGMLIIFAGPDSPMQFCMASQDKRTGYLQGQKPLKGGVWNVVAETENVKISPESGSVMNIVDESEIGMLLERYSAGASITCSFKNIYQHDETWHPLAVSKFGETVSMCADDELGTIFVFPQIQNKAGFIEELLAKVLPPLAPALFTQLEKAMWTHDPDYEFEEVSALISHKEQIVVKFNQDTKEIEDKILAVRASEGWIHDLLTSTGDDLVNAIVLALEFIGFENVVDMDKIRDSESKSRREDLRIDGASTLIIDIKGVGGKASDEDLTQASKHVLITMQETRNVNIKGLSIVNQQRHLPPLQRDNITPFRIDMLNLANHTMLGLMTTFDLYRIVVNKKRHNWVSENLKPLFYKNSRIVPVPENYLYLGEVSKVFPNKSVLAMHVLENQIQVGDRLAVEGDIYFEEVNVDSIMVNETSVESAVSGDRAGFIWKSDRLKIREGMRVFGVPASI